MVTANAYAPFNADTFSLWEGTITAATPTHIQVVYGGQVQELIGAGFQFDMFGNITGGILTQTTYSLNGVPQYEFAGLNHGMATVSGCLQTNDWQGLLGFLFNGNDTFNGSSGNDVLNGYTGDDAILAGGGNDIVRGLQGSDTLDGGGGADTVVLSGPLANYRASGQGSGLQIVDLTGADGTDFVTGVERFDLADMNLALDLGAAQAAGNTVRIIGAAFDAPTIQQHPDYVGIGLNLFDSGMSMLAVCEVVIGAMGNPTNEAFVNTVYENVVGVPPPDGERALYVGLLQGSGGAMTQAQLLELAANTEANAVNIDLVGLQASGVEFV